MNHLTAYLKMSAYHGLSLLIKQRRKPSCISVPVKHIIYPGFRVYPNFNHRNNPLALNLFKTIHTYSS